MAQSWLRTYQDEINIVMVFTCEYEGCGWTTDTNNEDTYATLYKLHVGARHQNNAASKAEKAKRPELSSDISDEDWSYFISRWTQYKKATGISGDDIVTQLMECCSERLRRDHHRTFSGGAAVVTEASVLAELKQITVCKRNKAVNRVKLSTMKQDRGEPVRKFAGRVRSLAAVSSYSVKCSKEDCGQDVSYTEAVIMDQIITGLADTEIQKDVLSHTYSDTMTLETLLKFIEGKESGLVSQGLLAGGGGVSAVRPGQGQGKRNCRFCGEKHPWGKEHCRCYMPGL